MLQQTQVKSVIPFYERWMKALPNIRAVAKAPSQRIHKLWEGLGYYTRVRNLQTAARIIEAKQDGEFPVMFADVLALPGVGPYTAGAICSIAFNQPTPILDGNVIRVLTRIFGISGNPRERKVNRRLWSIAQNLVSGTRDCSSLNQSLMELGALICTPKQPKCDACPVIAYCSAHLQNRVEQLPNIAPRLRPTQRQFAAFILERENRFLVRQRPHGVVNAHLWEFPNLEIISEGQDAKESAETLLGVRIKSLEPFWTIKHSITRYRIRMDIWRINEANRLPPTEECWFTLQKLVTLPFASAHKRVLLRLLARNSGARVKKVSTRLNPRPISKTDDPLNNAPSNKRR